MVVERMSDISPAKGILEIVLSAVLAGGLLVPPVVFSKVVSGTDSSFDGDGMDLTPPLLASRVTSILAFIIGDGVAVVVEEVSSAVSLGSGIFVET